MTTPHSSGPRDHGAPAGSATGPTDPAGAAAGTDVGDADATEPALALAGVWDLLDVLPPVAASPALSATTLELAAVPAGGAVATSTAGAAPVGHAARTGTRPGLPAGRLPAWLPAALVVLGGLGVGYAAGRATAPDPDRRVLDHLPEIEHLDLLREAGSVSFLEEIAKGGYAPPRRLGIVQSPAEVLEDTREFDAAIEALRKGAGAEPTAEVVAARRGRLLAMPDRERREVEKSVEAWLGLPTADQRELVRLARALAEPRREALLGAARLWHQWVRQRDPADRRDVIELGIAERLEWLDRATRLQSRFDQQRPPFDRDWDNRRGFPGGPAAAGPGGGQPGGPRGPGQPSGFGGPRPRPPGRGPGGGPPAGQDPGPRPGPDGGRPPFNGREPPPERPGLQGGAETPPPRR